MTRKEIKRTSDSRGFAPCGSAVVYDCKIVTGVDGIKKSNHPKQGSAKNCSVIAALSSIAAVHPNRIVGSYPNYTFLSKQITLSNDRKVPVTADGVTNVFASSNGGPWPMWWEKAYAKLISTATCPRPATCTKRANCTEPDIAAAFVNGESCFRALREIGRYTQDKYWTIPSDSATGLLLWPAIATTNSTLKEDAFWKRDHDYSVIKYDKTTKQYLIRNPCGGEERLVSENQFLPGSSTLFKLWGHVEY